MEKLSGRLEVVEKHGRFGPFQSGTLHTSIGLFKVKDKALEQFNAGTYTGEFLVEEIFIRTQPWKNGTFTELLARIAPDGYLVDTEEEIDAASAADISDAVELDPIDAAPQAPLVDPMANADDTQAHDQPPQKAPDLEQAPTKEPRPNNAQPSNEDDALFGRELAPLFARRESPIKLDPTVDRAKFKDQRARLKAVGYVFVAADQHWALEAK